MTCNCSHEGQAEQDPLEEEEDGDDDEGEEACVDEAVLPF
jgi:hypothetical protein